MAKRTQVDLSSLVRVAGESPSNASQSTAPVAKQTSASGKFDLSSIAQTYKGVEPAAEMPSAAPVKKKEESDTDSFWGTLFSDSNSEKPAAKAKQNDFINSLAFLDAASYGTGSKVSPKVLSEENKKASKKELGDYYKDETFALSSFPKLLASGTTRAVQAMDGIALFMAKAVEDTKALGTQAAMAAVTGSLAPFELDTHEKVKKAQQALEGGDRVKLLGDLSNSLGNVAGEFSRSAKRDIGFTEEDMNKGITDFVMEGEIGKAVGAAYAGVLENVPQMALLAATGGSSGAVFAGATAMGFGAGVADEYKQDKNVTYGDSAIALGKGLVEGVTETIFKTDIDAARTLGKSIFKLQPSDALDAVKKLIKEEGEDGAKEAIIRDARTVMKKMLGGGFEEGAEEILATLGEFVIDTTRKGEWSTADYGRLTKQVIDSFVIGAASGGLMSGGAAAVSYKPLEEEQQKKVEKYMEVANNETLSQEVREIAKKKADDIVNYNADKYFSDYTKVANLPMNERVQAVTILSQIKQLEEDKKQVKDLDTIAGIDNAIEEKATKVDEIIQNHAFNLAEEIVNAPNALDGNVAFAPDSNLTVSPDRGYVFHFNSKDEIPEGLRGLTPVSEGKVEARDKSIYRIAFTGQDLINVGLATQAQEVGAEQVSQATANTETTANTLQEILDKTPELLPTVSTQFQEQEGKTIAQQVAEAYQEAKKNNTNPELVSEVENAVKNSLTAPTMAAQPVITKKTNTKLRNPETLKGMKPSEGVEITPNIENDFKGVLGMMGRGTKRVLQNYVKALRSIHPEAKMFYYEDSKAMEKGLRNSGFSAAEAKKRSNTSGGLFTTFNNGNVIIHVNRRSDLITSGENAGTQSNVIAAHEVVHAVLLEVARTNPSEFVTMKNNLLEMLARDEAANSEIQEFVKRYSDKSENVQAEEFLAQLGALLTRQHAELKRTTLEKIQIGIREFLQKVAAKFKSKALMDLVNDKVFSEQAKIEDTARFLEGLGRSLREGTEIDMKYIKNLTKGSREYQNGLRLGVLEDLTTMPDNVDANTLMGNEMVVEPTEIKESANEANWLDNPENKKRMAKYVANVKGMTEDDIWLAKAISLNENRGIKLYGDQFNKEAVMAMLQLQMGTMLRIIDEEPTGREYPLNRALYFTEKSGFVGREGGYLFTGWLSDYIQKKIDFFTKEWNANEYLRWTYIRDNYSYHQEEVALIREIQQKSLVGNIKEFMGHNEFDPAFSYLLIDSIIYNKYNVVKEGTEDKINVYKYKHSQLQRTDAPYQTLEYDVVKKLYDNAKASASSMDLGYAYQLEYMKMPKKQIKGSKFEKYIDKISDTGEGIWLKFERGTDPETKQNLFEIARTSHKYPAKWCTGATDGMAGSQLQQGDFYVFVDNKTGDARIAVRYVNDKIQEVRGLGFGQQVLPEDENIINELVSTFKDGKAYESYDKTLKDINNIVNNFFTQEEAFDFKTKRTTLEVGTGSRLDDFSEYIAKNYSLNDLVRIMSEQDRSYNESDILLNNIQRHLRMDVRQILENMGESPNAIIKDHYADDSNADIAGEIKYIMGDLDVEGNTIHNFNNLISVNGSIVIDSGRSGIIANNLESINSLNSVGYFESNSLKSARSIYSNRRSSSFIVPNLEEVTNGATLYFTGSNINLDSLKYARDIKFNIGAQTSTINIPKLEKLEGELSISPQGDEENGAFYGFTFDAPSLIKVGDISLLKGNANSYGDVNINIPNYVNISTVESLNNNYNLNLNIKDGYISYLKASGTKTGLRLISKEPMFVGNTYVSSGALAYFFNVSRANEITVEGQSYLNLGSRMFDVGKLQVNGYRSFEGNNIQPTIDGEFQNIGKVYISNTTAGKFKLSVNYVEDLFVSDDSQFKLTDNSSIDFLELNAYAKAEISSKNVKRIKLDAGASLKATDLMSARFLHLYSPEKIVAPNLFQVEEEFYLKTVFGLSGKSDLSGLLSAGDVRIENSSINGLDNLYRIESITMSTSDADLPGLLKSSYVTVKGESQLTASKLESGYELETDEESLNIITDATGKQTFRSRYGAIVDKLRAISPDVAGKTNQAEDVKESVLGDIGQPSRQELEKRQKKTWGDKIRSVYQDIFERNENARKAFVEADMPFAVYSMYLKAGATPFAMHKFSKYFNEIYGGLDDLMLNQYDKAPGESQRHLDSIIFLNRVIAIDTNFDNRNKKRPAHPAIPQENGSSVVTNKESAEAELEKYKQTWGEEYFNSLQERSKTYFEAFSELLKYRYDNGLISKEAYDLYKDYNYSPRVFLEHFVDANGISPNQFAKRGVSLSSEQIKSIDKGSVDYMLFDSAQLLKTALIATENRVMTNRSLKFIYEEGVTRKNNVVKDANYDTYKSGQIKLNEDGSPKVREASNGYVNKTYRDNNGKAYTFQLKSDVAKEFDDVDLAEKKSFLNWLAKNLSGAPILQKMAVSLNPFFGLINPIIDLSTQVMFSNTYKGAGRGLIAQSIAASKTFVGLTKEMLAMNYNERFGDKTNTLNNNTEFRNLIEEYGLYGGFMTTQTEASAGTNKFAEMLGYYGNVTEITAKLSAYKFIKESMLADYASANIDPATGESKQPSKEEMRNIMIAAAYHARNTLDYNRGGKVAKSMSNYVPFLNVNLQVKKIGVKYIIENPADFVRKIADGIYVTAAITLANLIIDADDYEKDKNIKKHKIDKTVIMFPFKYEDIGLNIEGRPYLAIPTPTLAKIFFNIGQVMAEEAYYKAVGRENPNKNNPVSRLIEDNYNMMARDLVGMWIPPTVKAGISYFTNYDFWTQDVLTKDVKSVSSAQGMGNENILSAFKWTAQAIDKLTDKDGIGFGGGLLSPSPERFQKSMEVITTSPTYNGMANTAYWIVDNLFNEAFKATTGKEVEGKMKSKYISENVPESVASTFGKGFGRLLKSTEPSKYGEPDFDSEKDVRERVALVDARIATRRNLIYDDLRDMYIESKKNKESAQVLADKLTDYESKYKDRRESEYVHSIGQYFIDKKGVSLVTNANKYYTISNVAQDTRAKAFAIWDSFGDIRGNEVIINDLQKIGLSSSVIQQYNGILIEKGLIEPGDAGKPMYEDWYKKMLKNK
jgi:hypothetical protein